MLLAIDIGNTEAKAGLWDGNAWKSVWRQPTRQMVEAAGISQLLAPVQQYSLSAVICASVVPWLDAGIASAITSELGRTPVYLGANFNLGFKIKYKTPKMLGADRLASVIGALTKYKPPFVVVDVGTATKIEAVDSSGAYLGGAILPGLKVASQALVAATAKLPEIDLVSPGKAIGVDTISAIRSGVVIGHAAAIDGMALRFQKQIGAANALVATGGLASIVLSSCELPWVLEPHLSLIGLAEAAKRLKLV